MKYTLLKAELSPLKLQYKLAITIIYSSKIGGVIDEISSDSSYFS